MLERSQTVPNIYSGYQDGGNRDIVKVYNEFYMINLDPWQLHFNQAMIDRKVYLGDQRYLNSYLGSNYTYLKFVFNKAMRLWNVVSGHQRKNRRASRMVAVHNNGNKTASQKTKLIQFAYERDDTYHKISSTFDEAGITGLGLQHAFMDYRRDPVCGDFASETITADMVMMDAYWCQLDLSDCQAIATRKYLKKNMVMNLLPGREDDIMRMNDNSYYDNKFTFMPQQYNIKRKGVLAYDEFYYLSDRLATFVIDPETYESIQYDGPEEKLDDLRYQYPDVIVTKERIPTVKCAILVNNVCMYDGPNPLGIDMYPYAVLPAYMDTANNNYSYRYQGLMRTARDMQYLYNYRKQLELDLLAAQFSGVDVEVDALVDNEDAFKTGPGKARFFKKGRLNALRDVPGANINPANFQATEMIGQDMESSCGITQELLGMADDSDVGITTQLRQGAALTTLHKLFDNLDIFQRNFTRLADKIIEKNYTQGKIQRILGEEPTDEFSERTFQQYDCVVENAPMTTTTRQMAFIQRYQLWKDGFPIPIEDVIEYMEIQDKEEYIKKVKAQQDQQQQQQQAMAQAQLENQNIVNQNLMAKAQMDQASAMEKIAKSQVDRLQGMKNLAEADAARERATLDNMRAAKELDTIDLDQLQKLMDILMAIKMSKKEEADEEERQGNRAEAPGQVSGVYGPAQGVQNP